MFCKEESCSCFLPFADQNFVACCKLKCLLINLFSSVAVLLFTSCFISLRFRPPVAHKGWGSDVYDASIDLSYKLREKTCLQTVVGFGTMGSEDCLYVSVWVSGGIEGWFGCEKKFHNFSVITKN